jgi:hypothetical protein
MKAAELLLGVVVAGFVATVATPFVPGSPLVHPIALSSYLGAPVFWRADDEATTSGHSAPPGRNFGSMSISGASAVNFRADLPNGFRIRI